MHIVNKIFFGASDKCKQILELVLEIKYITAFYYYYYYYCNKNNNSTPATTKYHELFYIYISIYILNGAQTSLSSQVFSTREK